MNARAEVESEGEGGRDAEKSWVTVRKRARWGVGGGRGWARAQQLVPDEGEKEGMAM